ncbi:bifunctional phosphopantothenoylcysteine decarboxylase/phosphopantothenate--cysteine ligase CoaBC [Helicobacter sp. MIT 00-7814]|uniref:bifunctional phosphopantothenoylcysteine decarboxylase/phosphopantothenate--cysteine ligase CoaBC n=1 Tax=unclassified Helicobacter TaxID=2593540 RepID=UPI000E1E90CA|nr:MULTISPECIES: bifunctional phosphopantothenoylcysteine decarboxylase/phosphopantothenate--cysteine ligase CoaBC [unclassified Helicobacter]RDU53545.1 bifunctional phosphopantothenoylcysteine decarboxylase/phosphopantothenate--cysteine ligase CoaBC [Helicobacter sp. MIT 00-7814]RDU57029.1 bifunctional phosphopantothenoylcysteine decarboxylase/phosphopantothenate--cysteine ligase CoaBC [Helicobacter sp. MIT 99-10781]
MQSYSFLQPFFANKRILIVVSASVALYKILELLSTLNKLGAQTRVVMSEKSAELINPLLFEVMSKNSVLSESSQSWQSADSPNHISYAKWAQVVLVAPASANTIAKFACGIADNIALCTLLASPAPKIFAPAMNTIMLLAPQTQANLATLKTQGVRVVESKEGLLACGDRGQGALADLQEILYALLSVFLQSDYKELAEFWGGEGERKEVIITSGGSKEPLDSVRILSNLSSGKQAHFLALALFVLGAKVRVVGSNFLPFLPKGVERIEAQTTQEYKEAILQARKICKQKPYLFMAAALADFKPKQVSAKKLKKDALPEVFSLELEKNIDVLQSLSAQDFIKIGFKAESEEVSALECAKKMLVKKSLQAVCLNVLDSHNAFGSENNKMTLLSARDMKQTPLLSKFALSFEIVQFAKKLAL